MWLFKTRMCVVYVCICVCVIFLEENTRNQVGQETFFLTLYSAELFERVIFIL